MEEIKKKVEEIVNKVKNDGDFANKFKSNPVEAVESVVGIDLPDDQIGLTFLPAIFLPQEPEQVFRVNRYI